jgi:hypothetical protein
MNSLDMHKLSLARDFEVVTEAWWSLSAKERHESWAAFTDMLDHGDAGYHPFCLILQCAWEIGRDLVTPVTRNGPW